MTDNGIDNRENTLNDKAEHLSFLKNPPSIERVYADWMMLKARLAARKRGPFCKEREVWFAGLGHNIGSEMNGKNELFERPVLIIKKFNKDIILVVPLTTVSKPHNPYYCSLGTARAKKAYCVVSQIRLISTKRLLRRMYIVNPSTHKQIRKRIISVAL